MSLMLAVAFAARELSSVMREREGKKGYVKNEHALCINSILGQAKALIKDK